MLDGVLTTHGLLADEDARDARAHFLELSRLVRGPIYAAVRLLDAAGAYRDGKEVAKMSGQIVVQLPLVEETLGAMRRLSADGVRIAERAGLRAEDVLVKVRTRTIRNRFDWDTALLDLRVGEQVPLVVRRGNGQVSVNVAIADLPEVSAQKVQVLRELELVTLTPAIRAERDVRSEAGALVFRASDRITQDLQIQAGDVIVQVNRTPVRSAEDASRALDYYAGRGPIRMFCEREGQIFPIDFMIR
jgi:S1-C subfamily serine protease